jgi:hypothetical protein
MIPSRNRTRRLTNSRETKAGLSYTGLIWSAMGLPLSVNPLLPRFTEPEFLGPLSRERLAPWSSRGRNPLDWPASVAMVSPESTGQLL